MGRPLRRDEPGDIHHLFNRGLRRLDIAFTDDDRIWLIDELVRAAAGQGAQVLAYCIMGNHHHWMIYCPYGGVSKIMHQAMSSYVRAFNQTHEFDGPLFRSRFGSRHVDSLFYLKRLSRYIHRNPRDIGWAQPLEEYRFSSLSGYVKPSSRPFWLHPDPVLAHFESRSHYQEYIESTQLHSSAPHPGKGADVARHLATCSYNDVANVIQDLPLRDDQLRKILIVLLHKHGRERAHELAERFGYPNDQVLRSTAARFRRQLDADSKLGLLVSVVEDELMRIN